MQNVVMCNYFYYTGTWFWETHNALAVLYDSLLPSPNPTSPTLSYIYDFFFNFHGYIYDSFSFSS